MAKMKTKVKKLKITTILAVIALTFCALGLAGCSDAFSPYRKGYTAKVVYDFNGDDHTELGIRTFYYMPDSPIIKPEASKSIFLRWRAVTSMTGTSQRSTITANP